MRTILITTFIFVLASNAMADGQHISPLNPSEEKRLGEQRAVVTRHLVDDDLRAKFATAAGKLGTLRALLEARVFSAEQTYELQSLGVVLGDAFVQELGAQWVIVEDTYGRDPALQFADTTVLLFPLTMISKRIKRAEEVDSLNYLTA